MTSHKKKSDREWEQKLSQFAITGKIGKGGAPQKTDTIYYTKYTNIRNCPMFRSGAGKQATLWSSSVAGCNCGYKHVEDAPVVAAAAPAAAAAAPKPAVTIPFKIPKKPVPKTSIHDVRDQCCTISKEGYFDLTLFGCTNGRCPHCKSANIESTNINDKLKIIHTTSLPRYVQGIGMKCKDCTGRIAIQGYSYPP